MRVLVVGAGVIGLTTARVLLERGAEVEVVAERFTPETTSDVAAAIHFPYLVEPRDRAAAWGRVSLHRFLALAEDPDAGIAVTEAFIEEDGHGRWWADQVLDARDATAAVSPGGLPGHLCRTPVVAMDRYLPWLQRRVEDFGGRLARRRLGALAEISEVDAVVNCSGLGSRELVGDASLVPIRGQVAWLQNASCPRAILRERGQPTYLIPRGDGIVVAGGTAQIGDEGVESRKTDEEAFLRRVREIVPDLGGHVTKRKVGLRPGRPTVRLERDLSGPIPVVHNYGHGGAGVTLSWGCAEEAARLILDPGPNA
ncbi:MAG: FAD-dependent oxidoreductase [Candidatus Thermoplasmatota archaeon]